MSYRLVDAGYPTFKKIVRGRKWIGRVCKVQTGYLGIIGKTEYKGTTERECFDEVVARHCGFADSGDMDTRNRVVRAANSRARAKGRYAAEQLLSGNFLPFEKLLTKIDKEER